MAAGWIVAAAALVLASACSPGRSDGTAPSTTPPAPSDPRVETPSSTAAAAATTVAAIPVPTLAPGVQPMTEAEGRLVLAAAGPDDPVPDYDPLLAEHLERELAEWVESDRATDVVLTSRLRAERPDGTLLGIYFVCPSDGDLGPCRSSTDDFARWAGECRAGGGAVLGRVASSGPVWTGIGVCSVRSDADDPAEAVTFVRAVVARFGPELTSESRLDELTGRWARQRARSPEPMFDPRSSESRAVLDAWQRLKGERDGNCGALVLGRPTETIDVSSYRFLDAARAGMRGRSSVAFAVDAAAGKAVIDVVWCWLAP